MILSEHDINAIASRVAIVVAKKLLAQTQRLYPDLVTTEEAAAILHISPSRMRAIKDQYPYKKSGDGAQGRLLFKRDALYAAPQVEEKSNKKESK